MSDSLPIGWRYSRVLRRRTAPPSAASVTDATAILLPRISVQACVHWEKSTQVFPRSSPQSADGVFHRCNESRNSTSPQKPYSSVFTSSSPPSPSWLAISAQEFTLEPAAP